MDTRISVTIDDNGAIIRIDGRLDFRARMAFKNAANRVAGDTASSIRFDFGRTEYIDSAGLGMLLLFREHIGNRKNIEIMNSNEAIKNILDISDLHRYFRIS